MRKRIRLIGVSETGHLLRRALGPLRSWDNFLADLARQKPKGVHVRGFKLFPVASTPEHCPLYDPRDVREFIKNVWAADPTLKGDWRALDTHWFDIEDSPVLPWRMRQAEPVPLLAA